MPIVIPILPSSFKQAHIVFMVLRYVGGLVFFASKMTRVE